MRLRYTRESWARTRTHAHTHTHARSVGPTWVLSPQRADAGVEQVPPHAAELVQQLAAGDVVGVPQALRLQGLEGRRWRVRDGVRGWIEHSAFSERSSPPCEI